MMDIPLISLRNLLKSSFKICNKDAAADTWEIEGFTWFNLLTSVESWSFRFKKSATKEGSPGKAKIPFLKSASWACRSKRLVAVADSVVVGMVVVIVVVAVENKSYGKIKSVIQSYT